MGASAHASANLIAGDHRLIAEAEKIRFFPFAPVSGNGVWLTTVDGRQVLDFSSGWAVANVGYANAAVRRAVSKQLDNGYFSGLTSAVIGPAVALAEELSAIVPIQSRSPKVWFGHSGSDANECVARLVPMSTGRKRLVSFIGSYHGSTDGSAALSGHTAQARYAGSPVSVKVPFPDAYRPMFGGDTRQNEQGIIDYLDQHVLESISPRDDTAAIFVEAAQSDGGDLFPTPGFLRRLRDICDRDGIMLVVDEVKVGMGRTGQWWAYEHAGIRPDIVVTGKALGGGMPISAVVGPSEVLDVGTALALYTTAGNAACAAGALAAIETTRELDLLSNASTVGSYLKEGLHSLADRHPSVGDVRGEGLFLGVELVADRATKEPASQHAAKVVWRALELGVSLFYVGLRSNVLEITPPLTITREQAELGLEILEKSISEVEGGWKPPDEFSRYAGW